MTLTISHIAPQSTIPSHNMFVEVNATNIHAQLLIPLNH